MKPQRRNPPPSPPSRQSRLQPCTRSRSRSLLRCTRSGRKTTTQNGCAQLPTAVGSVKDLRIRRIFSPKASTEEEFLSRTAIEKKEREGMEFEKGDGVGVVMEGVSGASDEEKSRRSCRSATKEGGRIDDEMLQSSKVEGTPPDRDGVYEPESAQRSERAEQASMGEKVQNSRLRLFWNSSSHCYKRLLPFLMDITNNASSTLEILPCQNGPPKIDNSAANRSSIISLPPVLHQDSAASTECHAIISRAEEQFETQPPLQNSKFENTITDDPMSMSSPPNESTKALNDWHGIEVANSSKLLIENQVHMQHLKNDNLVSEDPKRNGQDAKATLMDSCSSVAVHSPGNLICEYNLLRKSENIFPINHESLSVEELAGCMDSLSSVHCSSRNINKDHQSTTSTGEADVKPHFGVFHSGIAGAASYNAVTPVKSILKRQRRDCKGTCTCLDCTSFIFNAEKAFEFSKKQLLDAEDVALGLMKELSYLRKMFVDSVVSMHGGESFAMVQLSEVQEIYRRASRAEDLARYRLKEMASDVSVRCRSPNAPHSRVSFSRTVEAKKILS